MRHIIYFTIILGVFSNIQAQTVIKDFQNYEELNSEKSDFGFTSDERGEAVFTSNRKEFNRDHSFYKIYRFDQQSGKIERIVKIPAKYNAGPAYQIPGSKEMFISLNRPVSIKESKKSVMEIWRVTSTGHLKRLKINGHGYSCMHPSVSPNGKYLYYSSDQPGGQGGFDIYCAEITDTDIGEPFNLGAEVNSSFNEVFPVAHIQNQLSFSSDRSGGQGGYDIYIVFQGKKGNFQHVINPENPVNSSKDDFYLYIVSTEVTAYLASNREGGKGDDDIYKMKLEGSFSPFMKLANMILKDSSGEVQKNRKIVVRDKNDEVIHESISNEKGEFDVLLLSNEENRVKIFEGDSLLLSKNLDSGKKFNQEDFLLPASWISIGGTISDTSSGLLKGTAIHVLNVKGDTLAKTFSDSAGNFSIRIKKTIEAKIVANKSGYQPQSKPVASWVNFNLTPTSDNQSLLVYFDASSVMLTNSTLKVLDSISNVCSKSNFKKSLLLVGHADYIGSDAVNREYGLRRAEACKKYLIRKGVPVRSILTQTKGEEMPLSSCSDKMPCEENFRKKDRRVEIILH